MTVQALSMSLAYCAWSAGSRMHHGTFEVESLEVANSPSRQSDRGVEDNETGPHPG